MSLNIFLRENNKKISIFIIILSFLISLSGLIIGTQCGKSINECLLETEFLMPDFYYNYNTIKYISIHGSFPTKPIPTEFIYQDDDEYRITPNEEKRIIYHAPLYYYLAVPFYMIAKSLKINDIFVLHLLSIILILITNILFYFILKRIIKYSRLSKNFIVYGLAIFSFLPTQLHISLIIGNDVLFYLLTILAFLFFFKFLENKNGVNSVLLGIIIGLSLLTKFSALALLGGLFLYLIIAHLEKKYKERNLLFISFLISILIGIYPSIRNKLLFGNIFGDALSSSIYDTNFYTLIRLFMAFFGGVYGGYDKITIFVIIVSLILSVAGFCGLFLYFKKLRKRINLDLIILTGIMTVLMMVQFICPLLILLKTGDCFGTTTQNRHLINLVPIIAIFSSFSLTKINKNKIVLGLVLLSCILYSIDFIYAFI